MGSCKVINGLNSNTTKHLVFDAGAFFKNYDIKSDTFDSAIEANKLIGATKGGGSFKAIPTFREIELDGMRGALKGTKILESWEVTIGANVAEVTPSNLALSLGVSSAIESLEANPQNYKKVTGKMCISDKDYLDNITWVGTISGSDEPVIIQVYNALNTKGLELSFEDKGELVIEMEFVGHFDMKNKEVPFAIYYPKLEEVI
ncbi:MAG: hypothetical protein PUG67_08460 [Peptoniphilaceae bacterium]|nr:hypothetical protein [Peptoniphilaceae bacterium]MDY6018645.1 hypothetical protein [Anaerococcus sp.]